MRCFPVRQRGFSLIEMALVLLIIGLLTKSAIAPLMVVQEHGKRQQATMQLQQVREAVLAHLVAYGALPCPLPRYSIVQGLKTVARTPAMVNDGTDICHFSDGFVDAYSLRVNGIVSDQGALLDPWGREYRYVVSLHSADNQGSPELPDWTTPGEASAVGISNLSSGIVLCKSQARDNCSGTSVRSDQIAFVLFSTAADSSSRGLQKENLDNDDYFVSDEESIVAGAEYDDLMVWASTADVSYWMLRMGWLP